MQKLATLKNISFLILLVLSGLSIFYYKERMLCLDACFQSFEIIKDPNKIFEWFRFGSFFPRFIIGVALVLHWELKSLLIAQSFSFVAIHIVSFIICLRVFKQEKWAVLTVLFCIFFVNNTFYWTQNELIQAIAFNSMFWAYLFSLNEKKINLIQASVISFSSFTLAFFHPLMPFAFLFISLFFLVDTQKPKQLSKKIYLSLVLMVLFTSVRIIFFENPYDHRASARFNFSRVIPFLANINNQGGWQSFANHIFNDFWLLPVSVIFISIYYLRVRAFSKLALVLSMLLGYCFFIMVSYNETGNWFHIESQYLPASLFLIIPLVFDVFPYCLSKNKFKRWVILVLLLVVTIRIFQIYTTHFFYTDRLNYISSILEKTKSKGGTKFITDSKEIEKNKILNTWAFAYESLYLSALQSKDSTRSVCVVDSVETKGWMMNEPKVFFSVWDIVPYSHLNKNYFNFTDTTTTYKLIHFEH